MLLHWLWCVTHTLQNLTQRSSVAAKRMPIYPFNSLAWISTNHGSKHSRSVWSCYLTRYSMASGTLNTAFPQNHGEPSKGSKCKKAHLKIRIITLWVGSSPGTHRPSDIFSLIQWQDSLPMLWITNPTVQSNSAIQRIWAQLFVNFYFRLPFSGCQTENKIGEW